ncbi:MAG: 50S ribosomal protein L9 [Pseudomonadota bacterium]
MKVILLETMSNLGSVGEIVDVKPGYARNYLLPLKKAASATVRTVKHVEHQKRVVEHKLARLREASEELKKKLEKEGIQIRRKAGDQEKLFGSVSALDVEASLRNAGIIVSRKGIHLEEPIRKVGTYKIPVKLDGGLVAQVTVEVVGDAG